MITTISRIAIITTVRTANCGSEIGGEHPFPSSSLGAYHDNNNNDNNNNDKNDNNNSNKEMMIIIIVLMLLMIMTITRVVVMMIMMMIVHRETQYDNNGRPPQDAVGPGPGAATLAGPPNRSS